LERTAGSGFHQELTPHLAADVVRFLGAIFTGGVLVPLLLPWLPSRAFSVKGAVGGALWAAVSAQWWPAGTIEAAGVGAILRLAAALV